MPDHVRIHRLLIVHLVAGVASCWYCLALNGGRITGITLEYLPLVFAVALVLAQASLLGLWAGFSAEAWWARLVGLISGAFGLHVALVLSDNGDTNFALLPAMTSAMVAVTALVLRRRGVEPRHDPETASRPGAEGLQFSIRGLMIFTVLVALLLGGARALRETFGHGAAEPVHDRGLEPELCRRGPGLGLGDARSRKTLAAGPDGARPLDGAGALFSYGVGQDDWKSLVYFTLASFLQSVIVLASLLVVRSVHYRLVAREPVTETPTPEAIEAANPALP